ncbi:PI-PLC X domain-containing protein 1 isoform X2 [Sorex araneus]|uniref:PI-PLC X domain-containing protein 1 isoform X2 n=1 Tax=Sorex araneus TaxID=42254 RepID=UPI002433F04F|nr:PI-PLC X domain-containing protein 1 isoform X2 [Sorex araneus]
MGGQISASGSFHSLPCPMDNADWMSALCPRLWDVPLHHLSIPGSHDTMTYCLNTKSPISHEQSWLLQLLGKVLPCVTRPVVLKWSITQALNITEQLDAGVRYLDLRIAHMLEGSEKNLHFVHMVYTTALVEDVPTLRQLWAKGQQVVLSYEDEDAVSRHQELWPGIPYWWGNKVKAQELVCYLEHMKSCGRPDGLFVAGINLTENLEYVLVHPSKSLKKMTLPSLPYLCAWVREQYPGPGGRCTNIIAGDFIGADTFVSDVIRLNDKLLGC